MIGSGVLLLFMYWGWSESMNWKFCWPVDSRWAAGETSQNLGEDGLGESSFFDPTLKVKEEPEMLRSHEKPCKASFSWVCSDHIHEFAANHRSNLGEWSAEVLGQAFCPWRIGIFTHPTFGSVTRKETLACNRSVECRFIEEGELVKKEAKMIKKVQEKELGIQMKKNLVIQIFPCQPNSPSRPSAGKKIQQKVRLWKPGPVLCCQALGIDKKDEKKKKEEEQKKKDEKKKEEEEAGHFGIDWYYLWFIPDECVGPTLKANSGEGAACQEDWAQGLEDHAASKSVSNFLPSSIAVTITIIIVRSSPSSTSSSSSWSWSWSWHGVQKNI